MDMLRRIFGMGPATRQPRQPFVQMEGPDARLIYQESSNPVAIAARENFAALYGRGNLPPSFAMEGIIEVRGPDGNWTPVTGTNTNFNHGMEMQAAALQSYRETGIIGPQAINTSGSMAIDEAVLAGGSAGGAGGPGGTGTPDPNKAAEKDKAKAKEAEKAAQAASKSFAEPEELKLLQTLLTPQSAETKTVQPGANRLVDMLLNDLDRRLQEQKAGEKAAQNPSPLQDDRQRAGGPHMQPVALPEDNPTNRAPLLRGSKMPDSNTRLPGREGSPALHQPATTLTNHVMPTRMF